MNDLSLLSVDIPATCVGGTRYVKEISHGGRTWQPGDCVQWLGRNPIRDGDLSCRHAGAAAMALALQAGQPRSLAWAAVAAAWAAAAFAVARWL
jgi:hypothetical protein